MRVKNKDRILELEWMVNDLLERVQELEDSVLTIDAYSDTDIPAKPLSVCTWQCKY